jgi:CLASP N terminal
MTAINFFSLRADGKTRALALEALISSARDGELEHSGEGLREVMSCVTECLGDNNIKISLAACDAVSAVAESVRDCLASGLLLVLHFVSPTAPCFPFLISFLQYGDILGDIFSSFGDPLAFALADLFGNAKTHVRERAMEAANTLMGVLGPEPIAQPIFQNSKLLNHKNWRVKEGILKLYTAQVLAFSSAAVTPGDDLLHACASALVDAQPEMRRAATDAFATMGLQRNGDLNRVLSILNTVAERRGIAIKPSHIAAIRERFVTFSSLPGSSSSGAGDLEGTDGTGRGEGGGEGWDNSGGGGYAGGGSGGGGYLGSTASSGLSASSSAPSSASKLKLKVPGPLGVDVSAANSSTGPASLASSHGSTGFSSGGGGGGGAASRTRAATAGSVGGGGWGSASSAGGGGPLSSPVSTASFGVLHAAEWDEVSSDPLLPSMCQLASSPHWKFAVLGGFTPAEVGVIKPIELSSPKDLVRLIDGVVTFCSTTTSDWAERSKALDRVRGLVAGGKKNPCMSIEGFPQQIARIRDCLCTQVQELRSTLAKQACLVIVELSAALSEAGMGWAFEPLAEPLAETLIKLTAVSIAVISSSADAAIRSMLHNAAKTGGYTRVLPKLTAGCRSKSGVTRAHAALYLLTALRGWPKACLDRHADELSATVLGLIRDADPNARLAGRHAFWSMASLYPSRMEAMLSKLNDPKLQRSLYSEESRHSALEACCEYLCSPMVILQEAPAAYFSPTSNAGGFAPPITPSSTGGSAESYQANGFAPGPGSGSGSAMRPQTSFAATGTGAGAAGSAAGASGYTPVPQGQAPYSSTSTQGIAQKEKPQTAGARVPMQAQGQGGSVSAPSTPKQSLSGGPQRVPPNGSGFAPGPSQQQAQGAPPSSAYRHYYQDLQQQQQQQEATTSTTGTTLPPAVGPSNPARASLLPPSSSAAAAAAAAATGGMGGGAVRVPIAQSAAGTGAGGVNTSSTASTARSDVASARSVLSYTAGAGAGAAAPGVGPSSGRAFVNTSMSAGSTASGSYTSSAPVPGGGGSSGSAFTSPAASPTALSASVLSSMVARALSIARGSPRATDLYTASTTASSSSVGHPLRLSIAQLLSTLVVSHAVDARSVCRVYAERLPEQLCGVIPATLREEFCVPSPATQPLLSDGQLDPSAALLLASQLQQAGGLSEDGTSSGSQGASGPISPLISLILTCLRHAHEYVQLDALAMLFTLLDPCVDVGGALSDALSSVMMPNTTTSSSSNSNTGAISSSSFGPEAISIDYSTSVRLFTVKVTTDRGGVPSAAVATPTSASAAASSIVVSIMPVFARLIMQQGGGSATGSNGSGGNITLAPAFIDLLHLVVALSSIGGSDAVRLAARRVISALRRAYTVPVLLAGVIACMSRPLSIAAAATSPSSGTNGSATGEDEPGAITAKTQAAALMLTLSLLGDAGACDFLFSHSPSLTRLLSRAAAMATAPAPSYLLASGGANQQQQQQNAAALAASASQKMVGYVEGVLRILGQSSPVKVGAALQLLRPEERALMIKLANNIGLDAKAMMISSASATPAPTATPAAAVPSNPTITFGGSGRPGTATATATGSVTAGSGAAATPLATATAVSTTNVTMPKPSTASSSTTTTTASSAAAAAPAVNAASLPFPVSKSNLELIRDSLVSGDLERVTRALHYLGRQVDLTPSTATSTAAPALSAGGLVLLPTSLAPVPFPHNEDPAYLSLVERVVAGVLTVIEHAAGLKATNIGGGSSSATSGDAPAPVVVTTNATFNLLAENGTGTVDAVLLSTALSVIRKLYRNAPSYLLPSCGPTFITLISACRYANREQLVVLERTLDEVAEKMPVDVTLVHLVAAIAGSPCAIPELSAICIASFRALTRCVPRMPSHYLLNECAKGRLMTAAVEGFNSPSTEVRRSVVQLLAALSISLRSHFTRYVDAYLTVPQSKLLSIYVEKALNTQQQGGAANTGSGTGIGSGGALAGITPAKP